MDSVNYSQEASVYDKKRYESIRDVYVNTISMKSFKTLLPVDKQTEIIDVGCGTGRGVVFLAQSGYTNITGIDYTQEMLDICRNKLEHIPNLDTATIKLIQGNAADLPFLEKSRSFIVSLNFLHLFELSQQKIFINEMARVLRPDGLLLCEFNNYYRGIVAGKRTLRVNPTLNLNKYSDFKNLFPSDTFSIETIRGSSLPYAWRIFQFIPTVGSVIEKIGYYRPFAFIAPRFYVLARKIN